MTPKEKAKEIYNKFDMIIYTDQDHHSQVKRCSLRAVDEILDDDVYDMSEELFEKRIEYWEEVKQEINNL